MRANAYAPYSRYAVGAAVLAEFGSPEMPVASAGETGPVEVRALSELLAEPFGPEP